MHYALRSRYLGPIPFKTKSDQADPCIRIEASLLRRVRLPRGRRYRFLFQDSNSLFRVQGITIVDWRKHAGCGRSERKFRALEMTFPY